MIDSWPATLLKRSFHQRGAPLNKSESSEHLMKCPTWAPLSIIIVGCTQQGHNFIKALAKHIRLILKILIFRNIFICVEEFRYMKDFMKIKHEAWGGRMSSSHIPLFCRVSLTIKHLFKHFEDKIKSILIQNCSTEITPSYLWKCFQRNSIPCYTFVIPSMLEEFLHVACLENS